MKALVYLTLTLLMYGSHLCSAEISSPSPAYAFLEQFKPVTFIQIGAAKGYDNIEINLQCGEHMIAIEPEYNIFYKESDSGSEKGLIALDRDALLNDVKNSSYFRKIQFDSDSDVHCAATSIVLEINNKKFVYSFLDNPGKPAPLVLTIGSNKFFEEVPFPGSLHRLEGQWLSPYLFYNLAQMDSPCELEFVITPEGKPCRTTIGIYKSSENPNVVVVALDDINIAIKESEAINSCLNSSLCVPKWAIFNLCFGQVSISIRSDSYKYKMS